ncbi:protein kinase [Streptomyces californicus]
MASDGPRVLDFGIARALESTRLTATGTAFGTPGFLAPEQAQGQEVGGSADVFALGAVLVAAAGGSAFGEYADGHDYWLVHEPPDLAAVPEGLRPVVAACLAKDPEERPTPASLLDRFAPDATPSPSPGPRPAHAPTAAAPPPPPATPRPPRNRPAAGPAHGLPGLPAPGRRPQAPRRTSSRARPPGIRRTSSRARTTAIPATSSPARTTAFRVPVARPLATGRTRLIGGSRRLPAAVPPPCPGPGHGPAPRLFVVPAGGGGLVPLAGEGPSFVAVGPGNLPADRRGGCDAGPRRHGDVVRVGRDPHRDSTVWVP